MLDGRSGRFLRGGSVREVAGRKNSKDRIQPEEPVNPKTQPTEHAWHGKGLQKQEKMKKSIASGRASGGTKPSNFTHKGGNGQLNWGSAEMEASLGGYDNEDIGMEEVDNPDNVIPIEPNIQYSFTDIDIHHKSLAKKTKPMTVQPESHKNPDKHYAENWLEAEEIAAYEQDRDRRERSRSTSPLAEPIAPEVDEVPAIREKKNKHHGGVKHGHGKHKRIHELQHKNDNPTPA